VLPWRERRRLSELNETFPAPAAVPEPLKGRQAQPVKRRQSQG
jgi:hypothetical protein